MSPLISAVRSSRCLGPMPVPMPMPKSGARQHIVHVRHAVTAATTQSASSTTPYPAVSRPASRQEKIKNAKPFSEFLTDTFHRQHDYLRISLTEKCNLRCVYCMPEEGVPLSPQRHLLTTPEIVMLSSLFVSQGVTKIRLTGGEPTVRKDILPLMRQIGALRPQGLRELCLTSNGLALHRKLEGMVEAGLTGLNLSLDTLDPWQFQIMTRRNGFEAVMKSIERVLELNKHGAGIKLKINSVIMRGINEREILSFVEMTREKDIEVRFIEYMPFDGNKWNKNKMFSYSEMLDLIKEQHPEIERLQGHKNDTSKTYKVPGFVGSVGFITSMTHNFCGTCNRLRITSDGNLKVCLFGNAEVSLRDILRKSNNGEPIDEAAFEAMKQIERNGKQEVEGDATSPSMSPNEQELLDVIGMAVKRKKAKHAGIGELEHMKNRPMILIDSQILRYEGHHHMPQQGLPSSPFARGASIFSSTSPLFLLPRSHPQAQQLRCFSTARQHLNSQNGGSKLTHVSESGAAHMVSISDKVPTKRLAKATCSIQFSEKEVCRLVRENQIQKGDVLGVARIAGIMAAKRTPDFIPLCHPIPLSKVSVELEIVQDQDDPGRIDIEAAVACEGKTGVEMEALTAASTAALTIYDMCKAVDKRMTIGGLKVVLKEGGKSGRWVDGVQDNSATPDA
ncbi:molybdenum cofactor biosynthesis protein 1 B [Xylaria nigripes]|nr:molybdenum cofactor biosynthesis protein 1 B [Xylaria nigripes]